MAVGLGAKVSILDVNVHRLDYLADIFGNELTTLYSNAEQIEREVSRADLVIGAVLVPGAKAPKLVSREMISKMAPGGSSGRRRGRPRWIGRNLPPDFA